MHTSNTGKAQSGFSLIELLITLAILLTVSAIVLSLTYDMTVRQASVANRSDMHSSVRSVTEMLQQEITQAGRITFPAPGFTTLSGDVTTPTLTCPPPVLGPGVLSPMTVADPSFLFDGIRLIVDIGDCQEVVAFDDDDGDGIGTAIFKWDHLDGAMVRPAGAFGDGILATSTDTTLKMFGDINDNGNMVYVEYVCNPDAAGGTVTRAEVAWNYVGALPEPQILLRNVLPNPPLPDATPVPCFSYQESDSDPTTPAPDPIPITVDGVVTNFIFALNVGVTLTAKAEFNDMQTGAEQVETKALLNVSPRNVFEAWELASASPSEFGTRRHVQPTPPTITTLAP